MWYSSVLGSKMAVACKQLRLLQRVYSITESVAKIVRLSMVIKMSAMHVCNVLPAVIIVHTLHMSTLIIINIFLMYFFRFFYKVSPPIRLIDYWKFTTSEVLVNIWLYSGNDALGLISSFSWTGYEVYMWIHELSTVSDFNRALQTITLIVYVLSVLVSIVLVTTFGIWVVLSLLAGMIRL